MRKAFDGHYGLVRDHLEALENIPSATTFFVHQSNPHTLKVLVGTAAACGVRQASGEMPLSMSGPEKTRSVALRPEELSNAAERAGRVASAAPKELAAALGDSLKAFLRLWYEKRSPSLQS